MMKMSKKKNEYRLVENEHNNIINIYANDFFVLNMLC